MNFKTLKKLKLLFTGLFCWFLYDKINYPQIKIIIWLKSSRDETPMSKIMPDSCMCPFDPLYAPNIPFRSECQCISIRSGQKRRTNINGAVNFLSADFDWPYLSISRNFHLEERERKGEKKITNLDDRNFGLKPC